jgi:UDP-4-amino-4,6-dideoxy-N-acetyl-beta-L-altrosamine transaminase
MKKILYARQDVTEDDIESVVEVLRSDMLTQGGMVPNFESKVSNYCGAKHAVAVNSGTSALHIACLALGLKNGDWLWTTPISFVASANCGLYCDAKVDFVDIDPYTYNLCPKELEKKLILAEQEGKLPKIIIPVHMTGQPCDMKAIHTLSRRFNFKIIEDASHAIGGKYLDQPIGNSLYSDITVFSFHPVKIITTGEGGMAVTNDDDLAILLSLYRSHGITRDKNLMTHESDGLWYYQQIELGFNYRMTDIQAALGVSQMNRLDEYVSRRHVLSKRYDYLLKNLPITVPTQLSDVYSGMHLYVIRLKLQKLKKSHNEVFNELRSRGIIVNLHYIPIHTQPYYQNLGFKYGDFPESEKYYSEVISLPMYPRLTNLEQNRVVSVLKEVLV